MFANKTYWIVGASEGLGRSLAQEMNQLGARLILSARNPDRLAELAGSFTQARALAMDVSDPNSVAQAAANLGRIDGVIYCAGAYEPMSANQWNTDAIQSMTEVNYFGATRVLAHVVPDFIQRNQGHIALIGSLAGFRGLPGAIGYSASKAALMHLAENLYADLRDTQVIVQQINPGFIKTRLTDKNEFNMPQLMTPEQCASRVVKILQSRRFSTSFPHPFAWLFTVGRFLPRSAFYRLFPTASK